MLMIFFVKLKYAIEKSTKEFFKFFSPEIELIEKRKSGKSFRFHDFLSKRIFRFFFREIEDKSQKVENPCVFTFFFV